MHTALYRLPHREVRPGRKSIQLDGCEANWPDLYTHAHTLRAFIAGDGHSFSLPVIRQQCFFCTLFVAVIYWSRNRQSEKAIGWIGIIFVCFMCFSFHWDDDWDCSLGCHFLILSAAAAPLPPLFSSSSFGGPHTNRQTTRKKVTISAISTTNSLILSLSPFIIKKANCHRHHSAVLVAPCACINICAFISSQWD